MARAAEFSASHLSSVLDEKLSCPVDSLWIMGTTNPKSQCCPRDLCMPSKTLMAEFQIGPQIIYLHNVVILKTLRIVRIIIFYP